MINKTSYEFLGGANKIYVTDVEARHQEKEPYTDTDLPTYSEATAQSV